MPFFNKNLFFVFPMRTNSAIGKPNLNAFIYDHFLLGHIYYIFFASQRQCSKLLYKYTPLSDTCNIYLT